MITAYDKIKNGIEDLYDFLISLNIDAAFRSHLENDYLTALDVVEKYRNGKSEEITAEGREALGGLHELYQWIWSVKSNQEFYKLIPHLKMLSESAVRINSKTPMISPVTKKQDDKTNKLIETIVAMYAIKIGTSVDIDDPISSSGGSNPDVMFTYKSKRIAIACKTMRGESANAVLDNLRSAAKQIERAECDAGYIAINSMNILPHSQISNTVFPHYFEPLSVLRNHIENLYGAVKNNSANELTEIFTSTKVRPVILTFVHSNTRLTSVVGNVSTMLKATYATEMIDGISTGDDFSLLSGVNEFIHHRL
jgi:hypothetical protein